MTIALPASNTKLLSIQPEQIPEELRNLHQWVAWKLVKRPNESKSTKIPLNPNTRTMASSTDTKTWGSFAEAMNKSNHTNGIGFVFSAQDPYTGIDLDKCRDVSTGVIEPWALEIIKYLNSYSELSPSGKGVHIVVRGKLNTPGRKKGQIEMYSQDRFFTFTGHLVPGCTRTIEDRQKELNQLHDEVFKQQSDKQHEKGQNIFQKIILDDVRLIERAKAAKDGVDFTSLWEGNWQTLYPSQSEADLALCGKLNFWCQGDLVRMDRLFRQSGLFRPKWDEPHFSGGRTYGQATLEKALSGTILSQLSKPASNKVEMTDHQNYPPLTDTWNAHRLVFDHGEDILWCEAFKQWYIYDGNRFARDSTREIERRAERTIKGLYELAGTLSKEDRQRMAKWAIGSESRRSLINMVESAKRMVPVEPTEFDRDPMLLNVANGTLNLRTQQLLPHHREDRLSKMSSVHFDPKVNCPLWISFLERIFDHDKTLIDFIQRVFGYCLTGQISEQVIFILYGMGANGKSTLLNVLRSLGGDYAYHCRPEVFSSKRNDSQGFELVPLSGARIVTSSETSAGRRLDEALVKEMTGGEPINCAPKYGDFFSFQPVFKPLLATNHKPEIRGADEGIWRRVLLIPFTVTIPEKERDRDLPDKLKNELSGILNWSLAGVKVFLESGLQIPEEVRSATATYRAEQDILGNWIEEHCTLDAQTSDEYAALYQDYVNWCETSHEEPINKSRFSASLDERGYLAHRGAKGKRLRLGIARKVTGDAG